MKVVPVYPEPATNYSKSRSTGSLMKENTILKAHRKKTCKAHNNICGKKNDRFT